MCAFLLFWFLIFPPLLTLDLKAAQGGFEGGGSVCLLCDLHISRALPFDGNKQLDEFAFLSDPLEKPSNVEKNVCLSLCGPETPKWVLGKKWRPRWNAALCGISSGSALLATPKSIFGEKIQYFLKTITCDPSIYIHVYAMDHPYLPVSNIMENSICTTRINSTFCRTFSIKWQVN